MSSPLLPPAHTDVSHKVPPGLEHGTAEISPDQARERAQTLLLSHGLPLRWQERRHFCILQTGFGLGHHFLATWAAWKADPARCHTLHFIALEQRPPTREHLAQAHLRGDFKGLARTLIDAWPPLLKGLHVLEFGEDIAAESPGTTRTPRYETVRATAGPQVRLTLALGDIPDLLPQLVGSFDAFVLEDLETSTHPRSPDLRWLRALGRLAAPGATAATENVTQVVRDSLESAGFSLKQAAQQANRQEVSVAHFTPRAPQRTPAGRSQGPWAGERRAVVSGAGLAGATAARALARQGWTCSVLDAAQAPASGASGNPAGLFHGVVHRDDGLHARLHRHAALGAARHYGELIRHGAVEGRIDGLLAVREADPDATSDVQLLMQDLPGYMQGLSQQKASAVAGVRLSGPALHYAQGGWVDPGAVVRHALAGAGVRFHGGAHVGGLRPPTDDDRCWRVLDKAGVELARAPLVVLATGAGLPLLADPGVTGLPGLGPLEVTRGQITWFNTPACLERPVSGHGYAVRLSDGRLLCGASLRPNDPEAALAEEDQRWNLQRLRSLTGLEPQAGSHLEGRVSWRLQTPDRLPLIGPVPRTDLPPGSRQDQVRFIARQSGLYVIGALGSRGLIWAPLAAQMLCAWVEATPMPLEADLVDALDPARWWVRQARLPRLKPE
jgi:tRNA 5-methylaminomethyl-2-thiouridine biosynthesis bifunctional protein